MIKSGVHQKVLSHFIHHDLDTGYIVYDTVSGDRTAARSDIQ